MTDTVALSPEKPRRLPTRLARRNTGRMLALLKSIEEREPLVWFSWNEAWDFTGAPHPGTFVGQAVVGRVTERMSEGVVRIGVPASVVTLRWSDYLKRNKTARVMREAVAALGNHRDWLATDQPVPFRLVRSMEAWYRGVWVDARTLDDDFDAWLAQERKDKDDGTQ